VKLIVALHTQHVTILLNREYVLTYMSAQGHGYGPFNVVSARQPPVAGDTKTRHILYKGNVSALTCSTSSRTLRNRFLFVDLYVSVLTPQSTCSESALQFTENRPFVFLCRVNTSYRYRPRTEQGEVQVPWGRHLCICCAISGQGQNLKALFPLFFLA
jgi:hypothetical protein